MCSAWWWVLKISSIAYPFSAAAFWSTRASKLGSITAATLVAGSPITYPKFRIAPIRRCSKNTPRDTTVREMRIARDGLSLAAVAGIHPRVILLPRPGVVIPRFPSLVLALHVRRDGEGQKECDPEDESPRGGAQSRLPRDQSSRRGIRAEDRGHDGERDEARNPAANPAHDDRASSQDWIRFLTSVSVATIEEASRWSPRRSPPGRTPPCPCRSSSSRSPRECPAFSSAPAPHRSRNWHRRGRASRRLRVPFAASSITSTIARYVASHRHEPNRDEHAAPNALIGVFTKTTGEAARTQGRFARRRVEPSDDGTRIPRNRRDDRLQDPTKAARRDPSLPDHPTRAVSAAFPQRDVWSWGGRRGQGGASCDSRTPRSRDRHLGPSRATQRERRPRFRPRADAFLAARRGLARAARGLGCAS